MRPANRATAMALGIAGAIVLLDQASKWVITAHVLRPPRSIEVTGFFNLVLVHNTGVSFGLLRGASQWQAWALAGLAVAVVAGLLYWLRRQWDLLTTFAVGLVTGGALGNVADRVSVGAVIDFLDFHLGGWHWPAFNVADSAITVGVGLLIFDGLFRSRRESNE